jgi:hypothetical protein
VKTEFKLTGRKKKRRKLNRLVNLFEVRRKFVNNIDINILINKQNLCSILKLHKKMHNNDRYFESVNSRKFQFYSQLIKRCRSSIVTSKTNYLLLKSSNIKKNEHLKIDETIKIISSSILFNEILEQAIATKERSSFEYEHVIFGKSENLIEADQATDGIIDAKYNHSIITAQQLRSTIQTECMSNNLQGETIPMAYSRFLDI